MVRDCCPRICYFHCTCIGVLHAAALPASYMHCHRCLQLCLPGWWQAGKPCQEWCTSCAWVPSREAGQDLKLVIRVTFQVCWCGSGNCLISHTCQPGPCEHSTLGSTRLVQKGYLWLCAECRSSQGTSSLRRHAPAFNVPCCSVPCCDHTKIICPIMFAHVSVFAEDQ